MTYSKIFKVSRIKFVEGKLILTPPKFELEFDRSLVEEHARFIYKALLPEITTLTLSERHRLREYLSRRLPQAVYASLDRNHLQLPKKAPPAYDFNEERRGICTKLGEMREAYARDIAEELKTPYVKGVEGNLRSLQKEGYVERLGEKRTGGRSSLSQPQQESPRPEDEPSPALCSFQISQGSCSSQACSDPRKDL